MFISRQLIVQICLICLLSYIYDINSFKALRKPMKKSLHHHILVSTSKDSIKLMNNIENRNAIEFQNDKKLQDNNNNNNSNKSKSFLWTSFPFLALLAFTVAPAFANDFSSLALSSATLNMELVSKYFLAGGVSCSISHGLSVPFDVVKTRKQVSKEMTGLSIVEVFKKIVLDDGLLMLFKGKYLTYIFLIILFILIYINI